MTWFLRAILTALLASMLVVQPIAAQGIRTLRDAEMENFLHAISDPIFEAAGMVPSDVDIVIVDDPALNAFYAGGQRIFIHTGLILQTDGVGEVIGVMAHETGHMVGGHVQRFGEAVGPATNISLLSLLLGAAAIAAGAPELGSGIIGGGQSAAQRSVLSFRRVQEASADQAAATYMRDAGISGRGLIKVFEKFRFQELLSRPNMDPYVVTHPLSSNRINNLESKLQASPHWDKPYDPELQEWYARIKAKLEGYLLPPNSTLGKYPPRDTSIPARYARVYAYNKALEWDAAMDEVDGLIAKMPEDPYFHEIKGQILLENGQVEKAIPILRRAAELAPDEPLILTLYGQALVATDKPKAYERAIEVLERATRLDERNVFGWYQLAIAYTQTDQPALANLASAERALLMGQAERAARQATEAAEGLERGSPKWLRAEDIRTVIGSAVMDGSRRR